MGTNYSPNLDSHSPQHKVGVIAGAYIDGNKVRVNGFLWQRDFPNVKRDLDEGRLGMSMELQDVKVRDANARVWYLEDFHFSGATILFKSAAAYTATSLTAAGTIKHLGEEWGRLVRSEIQKAAHAMQASACGCTRKHSEGGSMDQKKKKIAASSEEDQGALLVRAIASGVGPAISTAIRESLQPFVGVLKSQQASIARIAASVEESKALSLEAAKGGDEDEPGEEEEEIHAAKHEDDDMDAGKDEMDASVKNHKEEADDNDQDDSELDAALENLEDDTDEEDEVGELNKDAYSQNKGSKTTRTGKIGKDKSVKILPRAAASSIQASSVIRELYASHRALRRKYRTLQASHTDKLESQQNRIDALEAQVENYAERTDRRSVSAELANFLAKNNVDVRELRAEGKTLAVSQVDQIFASAPVELDPTTRMWFKNQLLQAGLMEQGEIHRGVQ
jgi:hypothetical protein